MNNFQDPTETKPGTLPKTTQSVLPEPITSLDNAQPLDQILFPNPPRPGTNQLPATIPNVAHLLDKFGVIVRYNVIKNRATMVPLIILTTWR